MEARSLSSVKCVGGLVRPQKRLQDVLSSCKISTLFHIILKEVSFTAEGEEARRSLRAKVSPTVSIFIHIIERVGIQLFIIPSYLFRVCKIRNDVSCFGPDTVPVGFLSFLCRSREGFLLCPHNRANVSNGYIGQRTTYPGWALGHEDKNMKNKINYKIKQNKTK